MQYEFLIPKKALRVIYKSLGSIVPSFNKSPREAKDFKKKIARYIEFAIEKGNLPSYSSQHSTAYLAKQIKDLSTKLEDKREIFELEGIALQLEAIATTKSPRELANT